MPQNSLVSLYGMQWHIKQELNLNPVSQFFEHHNQILIYARKGVETNHLDTSCGIILNMSFIMHSINLCVRLYMFVCLWKSKLMFFVRNTRKEMKIACEMMCAECNFQQQLSSSCLLNVKFCRLSVVEKAPKSAKTKIVVLPLTAFCYT